jgi:hypothetical protein
VTVATRACSTTGPTSRTSGPSPDRHHFRFIASQEDAADLVSLRTFTRELTIHWNTDNPHVHVLTVGAATTGRISSSAVTATAPAERELGPQRAGEAERWTSLDRVAEQVPWRPAIEKEIGRKGGDGSVTKAMATPSHIVG